MLGGAFAALVLLAVGSVLAVQWFAARALVVEFLNEGMQSTMEELERGVRRRLDPVAGLIDDLTRLVVEGRLDPADPAELERTLATALAGRPELGAIAFVRPDRSRLAASRVAWGAVNVTAAGPDAPLPPEVKLDLATAPEGASWGGVAYAENLRQPVLYVIRPVRVGERLLGHFLAGVTIGELSTLVDALAAEGAETPFILAGPDRVLAHPQLVDLGLRLWPTQALPGRDAVNDPVVAALWTGRPMPAFERNRRHGIVVERVDAEGGAIVATKQVTGYGDVPWVLGLWEPASLLSEALAPLRWGLVIGGGLLLLAVATAVLISRRVARPIDALTEDAARISSLELADVRQLPRSRIRELDEQAKAFNAMLATIRAFATYVPRSLVERLVKVGSPDAIASEERDLTVMFTDVQGFTRAAERLPAARIAEVLNEHFALLARCIEAEDGTVDKYLGDGLMAFWGAPDPLKDRAVRACRAALAIRDALEADNARRAAGTGAPPLRLRIGLHRGQLVVGNIGAPGRVNYTVVGDVVNVAQRLEQLGKQAMGENDAVVILASEAVVEDAGPAFRFEPLGEADIRGRREPVEAFRLLGHAAPAREMPRLRAAVG